MFTVIWAIVFFTTGHSSIAFGDLPLVGLIIALIADFVWWSPVGRKYLIVR